MLRRGETSGWAILRDSAAWVSRQHSLVADEVYDPARADATSSAATPVVGRLGRVVIRKFLDGDLGRRLNQRDD